jgi:hypothetical protein
MCFNLQKLLFILTKFFVNKPTMICFRSYPIATTSNPTFTNANINIVNNKKGEPYESSKNVSYMFIVHQI